MHRAFWIGVVTMTMLAVILARPAKADSVLDVAKMKAALRTVTIEENGFIEQVVAMAAAGKLPASMVESTFQWARKKPNHRFQYFKRTLILRAAKAGISL